MAKVLVIDDDTLLRAEVRACLAAVGFEVCEAEDGQAGLGAVHTHNPDVVILDFVMPKMNGVQFATALRSIANWRDLPIVLLSGRTEVVSEAFIERLRIHDVVSKPFEPSVLVAVVRRALLGAGPGSHGGRAQVPVLAESPPDQVAGGGDLAPLVQQLERRLAAAGRGSSALAEHLSLSIADLSDEELALVATAFVARRTGPALAGNLAHLPLVDVLQMLALQRKSGVLEISSGTRRIMVQLTQGSLEMAVLHGASAEHWLGRYLVAEEFITRQDLEMLLRNRSAGYLLGRQVVALGYATEEEVERALGRQTADILYEALRWQHGAFAFRAAARLLKIKSSTNRLDVSGVIMEGLRRVDEWRVLERDLPSLDIVLAPRPSTPAAIPADELSPEEAFVHRLVNGARSVRRIAEDAGLDSFTTCQYLYRMLQMGLVERRQP